MDLVDTHCHLQFKKLADHIEAVIQDAVSAGVSRMICVGTTLSDSAQAAGFAAEYASVWAAIGVHPHEAANFNYSSGPIVLEDLSAKPRVVAFGEIGLDFYKNYAPKDEQEKLFRRQLEIGLAAELPFIFHVRDAWADFWRIMTDYDVVGAVVHSFSSGRKQADKILEKGWYVGLNGIMTFTSDPAQLEAAKSIPLDKLLLETDAPFLTPVPHRGDTCEPKHVAATAEFLAGLRAEPIEKLSKCSTDNAIRLFGLS